MEFDRLIKSFTNLDNSVDGPKMDNRVTNLSDEKYFFQNDTMDAVTAHPHHTGSTRLAYSYKLNFDRQKFRLNLKAAARRQVWKKYSYLHD